MPGLVAQYPVAPFTTPVNGDDLDAALVVSHDSSIASAHTSHDADPSIHFQSSTLAARPGAGIVGRKWITTDGLRVYFDTGAAWSEIAYLSLAAGGVVVGATTFSAVITSTGGIAVSTGAAVTPLSVIGVNAFSRISRNEAAFAGALLQFDRSGVVAGYLGMDGADNLTIQRGADAVLAVTINRVTGAATFASAVTTGALTATTGTFSGVLTANGTAVVSTTLDLGVDNTAGNKWIKAWRGNNPALNNEQGHFWTATAGPLGIEAASLGGRSVQLKNLGGNYVVLADTGQFLVGTAVVTSAAAGDVVLANNKRVRWVNAAGTDTIRGMVVSNDNNVWIADAGTAVIALGNPPTLASASGGEVVLANLKPIRGVNAAGTDTIKLLQLGGSNEVNLGPLSIITLGTPGSIAGAAAGEVVLANAHALRSSNAGGTAVKGLIALSAADKVAVDTDAVGTTFGAGAAFAGALSGITTLAMTGALSGATTISASSSVDVGVGHVKAGTTTAVTAAVATTIYTAVNAQGFAIVHGSSAGKVFCDLIAWDTATPAVALLAGNIIAGVPGGRTYSMSGSNVQLQMSATGNSVKVVPIELN